MAYYLLKFNQLVLLIFLDIYFYRDYYFRFAVKKSGNAMKVVYLSNYVVLIKCNSRWTDLIRL